MTESVQNPEVGKIQRISDEIELEGDPQSFIPEKVRAECWKPYIEKEPKIFVVSSIIVD